MAELQKGSSWGGAVESCNIIIKDSLSIDWRNAVTEENGLKLTRSRLTTEVFYLRLNGVKYSINHYFKSTDLKEGNNTCELVVEDTDNKKSKVIALFSLQASGTVNEDELSTYLLMEVEREIPGNPHRIDYYRENTTIASQNDISLKTGADLKFRVWKVIGNDTVICSNEETKWYRDNNLINQGIILNHQVISGEYDIKALLANGNSIKLTVKPDAAATIDGRIRLDYSRVSVNRNDTILSGNYFNAAYTRCNKSDLGNLIRQAPKEIVVYTERNSASGGIITQGEASDGAKIIESFYNELDLSNIHWDKDNAIIDAQLVSTINKMDRDNIINSIEVGKSNQRTEVLLHRIGRLSVTNREMIQSMINRKDETRTTILDTVKYEVTSEDDIKEWITFHTEPTINVDINLNDGYGSTINQAEFTRLMAHELLHHWWTHFKPFEKLKWKIIRDKADVNGYRLADGLSTGSPQDSNRGCSSGAGHERYNPEHAKVCTEQNKY